MSFNPSMLILARESRRMTQKALALASNTTQASVSRAEAGVHEPMASTVEAWARELRYQPAFFEHRFSAPPLPRIYWRKQAKLGAIDQRAIEASIAIRCINVRSMVRSVAVPESDVIRIELGRDIKSPSEAARFVRARWRVPVGPVVNLTALAEDNGILVVPLRGASGFQGVSICDGRKDMPPTVFLSADDPVDRQRWTLAHEIGHIFLHHHLDTTQEWSEDEANEFAGELLMPAHEIRHHFSWRTTIADLAQLKLHWRVSMVALLRRGHKLGRITEGSYAHLMRMLGRAGYRRVEPNQPAPEASGMLREIVRVHVEDLGFSVGEMAVLLMLCEEEVRSLFLGPDLGRDREPTPVPRLRIVK